MITLWWTGKTEKKLGQKLFHFLLLWWFTMFVFIYIHQNIFPFIVWNYNDFPNRPNSFIIQRYITFVTVIHITNNYEKKKLYQLMDMNYLTIRKCFCITYYLKCQTIILVNWSLVRQYSKFEELFWFDLNFSVQTHTKNINIFFFGVKTIFI